MSQILMSSRCAQCAVRTSLARLLLLLMVVARPLCVLGRSNYSQVASLASYFAPQVWLFDVENMPYDYQVFYSSEYASYVATNGTGAEEYHNRNVSTILNGEIPVYWYYRQCSTDKQLRLTYEWKYGYQIGCKVGCAVDSLSSRDADTARMHLLLEPSTNASGGVITDGLGGDDFVVKAARMDLHGEHYTRFNFGSDGNGSSNNESLEFVANSSDGGVHLVVFNGRDGHANYHQATDGEDDCNTCLFWEDYRETSSDNSDGWVVWNTFDNLVYFDTRDASYDEQHWQEWMNDTGFLSYQFGLEASDLSTTVNKSTCEEWTACENDGDTDIADSNDGCLDSGCKPGDPQYLDYCCSNGTHMYYKGFTLATDWDSLEGFAYDDTATNLEACQDSGDDDDLIALLEWVLDNLAWLIVVLVLLVVSLLVWCFCGCPCCAKCCHDRSAKDETDLATAVKEQEIKKERMKTLKTREE